MKNLKVIKRYHEKLEHANVIDKTMNFEQVTVTFEGPQGQFDIKFTVDDAKQFKPGTEWDLKAL